MFKPNIDEIESFNEALVLWGRDFQLGMVKEECAEMIVAISHYLRARVDHKKLLEEMVDTFIVLQQLYVYLENKYSINMKDFMMIYNSKIARLECMLEKSMEG